jgi:hypothetical protein
MTMMQAPRTSHAALVRGAFARAQLRARAATIAFAVLALLASCVLESCIGPGLDPPDRGPSSQTGGLPRPAAPVSPPSGGGTFDNGGTAGRDDGTTNPQNPEGPGATPDIGPPGDPNASPDGEADEDAGVDPADSP